MKTNTEKSAVEEILKGLEEEGKTQINQIIKQARAQAQEILKNARRKAEEEHAQIIKIFKQQAELEANKILKNADVEAEKILSTVKHTFLDEVFKKTLKLVDSFRHTPRYREALSRLLDEALETIWVQTVAVRLTPEAVARVLKDLFEGKIDYPQAVEAARKLLSEPEKNSHLLIQIEKLLKNSEHVVEIEANPEDVSVLEELAREKNIKARVLPNNQIKGGLKVATEDRRQIADNTIEARLNKLKRLYSRQLIERLL